jgi:hypothetical protein
MALPIPGHPWIVDDAVAPDKPIDSAVLSRLKHFSAMNKLKKMALRVRRFVYKFVIQLFAYFNYSQVDLVCLIYERHLTSLIFSPDLFVGNESHC